MTCRRYESVNVGLARVVDRDIGFGIMALLGREGEVGVFEAVRGRQCA